MANNLITQWDIVHARLEEIEAKETELKQWVILSMLFIYLLVSI